jgi:PPOX class probable F420-dependent enzyme
MADEQELWEQIAERKEAVLATIRRDGRPQLSNVLYVWDATESVARVSTTAQRAKARNLRRDPRATLYVAGEHFWSFAVGDCDCEIVGPTTSPGDDAARELLAVHGAFYDGLEEESFFKEMIDAERLVLRLRVTHVYGVLMERPPTG